tara:strand:+ start:193 stop:366 length:174 start_codon:yes stop_codon:yes gene_type:complete
MADKKRARTKSGKFIPDDPNTPENEAWVKTKSSSKKALPPKGSAEYKAMLLRGEIKE